MITTALRNQNIVVRIFSHKLMPQNEKKRAQRRILMYWAILKKAGFEIDQPTLCQTLNFNPRYNRELREKVYAETDPPTQPPSAINNLDELVNELSRMAKFVRENPNDDVLISQSSGNHLFEADELALLNFLSPAAGAGPTIIQPYKKYHDKDAGNFTNDILNFLDKGMTVILDLSNADPEVMEYFSEDLSNAIFRSQVDKFSNNRLGADRFVQLYFEEAHNLFPRKDEDARDIYKRLAKEGAKYHIGMVYSTQSVTGVSTDLLDQTENFFIAHLASDGQVNALRGENIAYASLKEDILQTKSVGYIRLLTRSHRFVIPTQASKFTPNKQ